MTRSHRARRLSGATMTVFTLAAGLTLAGCAGTATAPQASPSATVKPTATRAPVTPAPAAPAPTPTTPTAPQATEAVITFYGSDIQVLGSTYDDTPASEDLGRVVGPYSITVPLGVGFYWGAVSFNGAADAGCRVTVGDRVVIDNAGPNQTSATCVDYEGVQ